MHSNSDYMEIMINEEADGWSYKVKINYKF